MSEKGGSVGVRDPLSSERKPKKADVLTGKKGCPGIKLAYSGSGCAFIMRVVQTAVIQQLSSLNLFYRVINLFPWDNLFAAYTPSNI